MKSALDQMSLVQFGQAGVARADEPEAEAQLARPSLAVALPDDHRGHRVTSVAASVWAGTAGRLRRWLSVRHSLLEEGLAVLALYVLYESARGLVAGDTPDALRHAGDIVRLESATGVLLEERVQDAASALPGLIGVLNTSYLTLHLSVTVVVLLWLHRRRPASFPLVRTTLALASGLALVGYLTFPTAPPRLAGIGIADTVSGNHVDLNSGLVSSLYNPYAAVPSMHIGYALVLAAAVVRYGRRPILRFVGASYPLYVLLVVVATGNHFFADALAGAAVVAVSAAVALVLVRPPLSRAALRAPNLHAAPAEPARREAIALACRDRWVRSRPASAHSVATSASELRPAATTDVSTGARASQRSSACGASQRPLPNTR